MYQIIGLHKDAEVDDWEHGCGYPDSSESYACHVDVSFRSSTKEGVIKELTDFIGESEYQLNPCEDDPSRIDVQTMEDSNSYKPSESDMEQWKQGNKKLWCSTYSGNIETVELIT